MYYRSVFITSFLKRGTAVDWFGSNENEDTDYS